MPDLGRLTDPWYEAEFGGNATPAGGFRRQGCVIEGAQLLFLWCPCAYGNDARTRPHRPVPQPARRAGPGAQLRDPVERRPDEAALGDERNEPRRPDALAVDRRRGPELLARVRPERSRDLTRRRCDTSSDRGLAQQARSVSSMVSVLDQEGTRGVVRLLGRFVRFARFGRGGGLFFLGIKNDSA